MHFWQHNPTSHKGTEVPSFRQHLKRRILNKEPGGKLWFEADLDEAQAMKNLKVSDLISRL